MMEVLIARKAQSESPLKSHFIRVSPSCLSKLHETAIMIPTFAEEKKVLGELHATFGTEAAPMSGLKISSNAYQTSMTSVKRFSRYSHGRE